MKIRNILFVLAILVGNLIAGGATPVKPVLDPSLDSVNTARSFMTRQAEYYQFSVDIYIDSTDKKPDHRMQGNMLPDGRIISLRINDEVILTEADNPLLSLPLPKEGVIKFIGVYVNGHAKNEEYVSWGSGYAYDFERGNALLITVYPAEMQSFLAFTAPNGENPEYFQIVLANGWWGYYDSLFQGFVVRTDPSRIWTEYYIRDRRNGAIVARGVIFPFEKPNGVPTPVSEAPLSVIYGNGVVDGALGTRGYSNFEGQQLDGQSVDISGAAIPAKVYFTTIEEGQNLHVSVWGVDGKIEVFGATEFGEMPLLHTATSVPNEWDGIPGISIEDLPTGGHSKLIIKVTGKVVVKKGFATYLSDRYRG